MLSWKICYTIYQYINSIKEDKTRLSKCQGNEIYTYQEL